MRLSGVRSMNNRNRRIDPYSSGMKWSRKEKVDIGRLTLL
jgi:hypothetical protein